MRSSGQPSPAMRTSPPAPRGLWAREEMAGAVDVPVIDEAAQMSLANTLAVCQAAGSLVLFGDLRQLDQPI